MQQPPGYPPQRPHGWPGHQGPYQAPPPPGPYGYGPPPGAPPPQPPKKGLSSGTILLIAVLGLPAVSIAGCVVCATVGSVVGGGSGKSASAPTPPKAPPIPVELSGTVSPGAVRVGSTLTAKLKVTNKGSETIRGFRIACGGCGDMTIVGVPAGTYETILGTEFIYRFDLAPGASAAPTIVLGPRERGNVLMTLRAIGLRGGSQELKSEELAFDISVL